MKRIILLALFALLISALAAVEIGGAFLPEKLQFGENALTLNGAGMRKKVVIKVYACGLYLPQQSSSSTAILAAEGAIAIRMNFIYKKVDQEKLIDAWNEGFAKTGALQKFAIETSRFNALFSQPAVKGDIYDIVYLPGTGVQVIRNEVVLGTIENPDFRKAVFSIWLDEDTDLPKLRESLLGN
ncbi:MAG: chalcone isomerase family protein [Candidatus Cloacimonetes bacterium]|nr:chalcone isomerase family protein [Candidatus Cloacimonadota bacterium]